MRHALRFTRPGRVRPTCSSGALSSAGRGRGAGRAVAPRLTASSNMLDIRSTMKDEQPASLNDRIAQRVRDLRAARGLSLDALADPLRRQPLDDLADRARREQPHRRACWSRLATGLERAARVACSTAPAPDRRPRRAPGRPAVVARSRSRATCGATSRRAASPRRSRSSRSSFPPGARVAYETGARDAARPPAGVGARRDHRRHGRRRSAIGSTPATAWRFELDQPIVYPQPDPQDRALCRRDRRRPASRR